MLETALKKIRDEIEKEKNPYVQVVGEFLTNYLEMNPGAAEKIMTEGKTIIKSLDEMKKAAREKAVNGCAVLTEQEGFEIVLKYYGIEGIPQASTPQAPVPEPKNPVQEIAENNPEINLDFDIDEYL
jgi:hypothetical protein